jgi:hypothetical protein
MKNSSCVIPTALVVVGFLASVHAQDRPAIKPPHDLDRETSGHCPIHDLLSEMAHDSRSPNLTRRQAPFPPIQHRCRTACRYAVNGCRVARAPRFASRLHR